MGLWSFLKPKVVEWDDPRLTATLVRRMSKKYDLNPKIFASLIYQESKGNIWAQRYEPGFYAKYLEGKGRDELSGFVPPIFPTLDTERISRSYSFGSCQLLGETMRVLGFKRLYLAEACNPNINIEYGAMYLRRCLNLREESYKGALALYNGTRDHEASGYDEKVLAHIENGHYRKILHPGGACSRCSCRK